MTKKQLVRTLGLGRVLMLGIGGTMGAGVFVLTGHAVCRLRRAGHPAN
jgi:amino acid permease